MPNEVHVIPTRDDAAGELVESHFQVEPGIKKIFRLLDPDGEQEGELSQPIKLLEVNENTPPVGIRPIAFPQMVRDGHFQYPVIIVEITPKEFDQLHRGELVLPNGWTIGQEYQRPAA